MPGANENPRTAMLTGYFTHEPQHNVFWIYKAVEIRYVKQEARRKSAVFLGTVVTRICDTEVEFNLP